MKFSKTLSVHIYLLSLLSTRYITMDTLPELKNEYLLGPPHHQKGGENQISGLSG